jgi:hypothetical protein
MSAGDGESEAEVVELAKFNQTRDLRWRKLNVIGDCPRASDEFSKPPSRSDF